MRLIGFIIAGCIIFAAARIIVGVLLLLLALGLLWTIVTHPKESIGFLICCCLIGLVTAHPTACIVLAGAALLAKWRSEDARS